MRTKYTTLSQKINQDVTSLNLPRNSIHDAYILKFKMTLTNETESSITPTIKEVLDGITELSVISDSTRAHYSNLTGYDLALLGARMQKCQTNNVLGKTYKAIPAGETVPDEFVLYLDEGDIVAVAHNALELRCVFADVLSNGLTVSDASLTITIIEKLCTTAELMAKYGEDLRAVAEPKVYTITADVPANSEFSGCVDIPTSTLLKGAIIQLTPTGGTMPTNVGLLRTVPDRVELMNMDFATHRALDEVIYQTTFPEGVLNLDYGTQWQDNKVGKDGWSFAKADVQFAMKNAAQTKVRYISLETLVDTALYMQSGIKFTEY